MQKRKKQRTYFILTLTTDTEFKFNWARKVIIEALQLLVAIFIHWEKKAKVELTFNESDLLELSLKTGKLRQVKK